MIIEITIIKDTQKSNAGKVYIKTNLPDPIPPHTGKLTMSFHAVDAEKYCLDNFPNIKPNIISSSGR